MDPVEPTAALTRDELEEKHGTPEEFQKAVWNAANQLMITDEEAKIAIRKYLKEWSEAVGVHNNAATEEKEGNQYHLFPRSIR
jgi:hypothetical protein